MSTEKDAAAALQRLSRGFLARRSFREKQAVRQVENERLGVKAPFVPTPQAAVDVIRDQFVLPGDAMCDLGCGDGRVLLECASKLESGLGVDIQEEPLAKARAASSAISAQRIMWLKADFFSEEVIEFLQTKATVCFLFLLPDVISLLVPFLAANMRPNARIVCYTFPLKQLGKDIAWPVARQTVIPGLPSGAATIYEYIVDDAVKKSFA